MESLIEVFLIIVGIALVFVSIFIMFVSAFHGVRKEARNKFWLGVMILGFGIILIIAPWWIIWIIIPSIVIVLGIASYKV